MMFMYQTRNNVSQTRFGLVAAVMCGILAVSTAIAWLQTKPEGPPTPGGAEILSKIASGTLGEHWDDSRIESWFIQLKPDLKPVAWRVMSRGKKSEDVFSGSMVAGNARASQHQSTWRVSSNLSEGLYIARGITAKGQQVKTRIALSLDEVVVTRNIGGEVFVAAAARPDNYVPEGLFDLMIGLVAKGGEKTTIKMIHDEISIVKGKLNFTTAILTPRGKNVVKVDYPDRGSRFSSLYQIDEDRNVSRYENIASGIIHLKCEKELVADSFNIPDSSPTIKPAP
jgi:hypothetical protein